MAIVVEDGTSRVEIASYAQAAAGADGQFGAGAHGQLASRERRISDSHGCVIDQHREAVAVNRHTGLSAAVNENGISQRGQVCCQIDGWRARDGEIYDVRVALIIRRIAIYRDDGVPKGHDTRGWAARIVGRAVHSDRE